MSDDPHLSAEEQEAIHFQKIVKAFIFYKYWALKKCERQQQSYDSLSDTHKALIPHIPAHLDQVRHCIFHNYEVIKMIVRNTKMMFENTNHTPSAELIRAPVSDADMDKLRSTLQQLVRDWADEGAEERKTCYDPIIQFAERTWPDKESRNALHVLVPGAGLGRLAHEFASRGFNCQGNEWSLFMLFASNFVLNMCKEANMMTIYPWVHQFSNNKSSTDQLKSVRFPDVSPSNLPENVNFSMAAGDFLEIYTKPAEWDCIATVFFIDTASNIISYIETMYSILKPGGYWINLGPLLYHYADMPGEVSIELSYEDVKRVVLQVGFELEEEKLDMDTKYTQNPNSMLHYSYKSVFFVAKKPDVEEPKDKSIYTQRHPDSYCKAPLS